MSEAKQGHSWSGWPGAYCQKCGVEDAMETALALGWIDFEEGTDPDKPNIVWKSDAHKNLVEACNSVCSADLTTEEGEAHLAKVKALDAEVKRIDGE